MSDEEVLRQVKVLTSLLTSEEGKVADAIMTHLRKIGADPETCVHALGWVMAVWEDEPVDFKVWKTFIQAREEAKKELRRVKNRAH